MVPSHVADLPFSLSTVSHTLRAVAFWTAVALPLTVIAVLAVGGGPQLVGFLLVCNVVALVVGHGYRSHAERRPNREH